MNQLGSPLAVSPGSDRARRKNRRLDRPPRRTRQARQEQLRARKQRFVFVVVIVAIAAIGLVFVRGMSGTSQTPVLEYELINRYPHDAQAFTQGLIYEGGKLFESTGREGESSVRILDLDGGESLIQPIDQDYFGEGITIWQDRLIQLTWKDRKVLFFDPEDLKPLGEEKFPREAWGLTHDGRHLIMSDGSDTLRFLNPETMEVERMVKVRMDGRRLDDLNELEYADGHIFANVWYKDYVVKIAPRTGTVVARIDFSRLWPRSQRTDRDAVLNGIAYDQTNDRWFVTGKLWPELFEIRLKD